MSKPINAAKSSKTRVSGADKIKILKDWHNHECNVSFILEKYKISDTTFWRWRNELDKEVVLLEPSPSAALKKINALEYAQAVTITLATQKKELVNTAANILMERLRDTPKYIETKDLIAIIKLDISTDEMTPEQSEDLLNNAIKNYDMKRRADKKENAETITSE